MDYINSVKLLTSTGKFQIKLGLERIKSLLSFFDNPQDKVKVIHVAGTNGKGSVCSVLANILKCSGYKTGLYTSPHLKEYTERIQINGVQISQTDFSLLAEEICTVADNNNIDLTEFEILTAMAFKYFADNEVDFAIIETGLGGRFDASNVCKNPICSIITSISLDHTDRLGNTTEKIAYEKAGIIKNGSFVIVSTNNNGYKIIKNQAEKIGAKLISAEKNVKIEYKNGINYALLNDFRYEFPMLGLYQSKNLALVFEAVELLKQKGFKISLKEGLQTSYWAMRMEFIKEKNMLIDGAHNPDGAAELKKNIEYYFKEQKKIFIYGTINTKDYKTVSKLLFEPDDEIYYYEFHHPNAVSFQEYKDNMPNLKNLSIYTPKILEKKELKILTGSLYMIGDFLKF